MHFGLAQCKQKGSVLPVLLAVVALLGGYFWFINQTAVKEVVSPKQINKSNVYSSLPLGMEFNYPVGLTVQEDSEEAFNKRGNGDFRKNFKGYVGYEPGIFTGAVVVLNGDYAYETNPLTIWVFNDNGNLTIEEWYTKYWYYPFVWGDFTHTGKNLLAPKDEATISGKLGKSGIIDYQPGKPKFVYVTNSGKMYLFRIIGDDGDKVLQTFKFTI